MMTIRPRAVVLYESGFQTLVSVIPPDAPLSPGSAITLSQRGKVPGRRNSTGTWAGYPWLTERIGIDDVRTWAQAGANIGIQAEYYPAVDIDTTDPWLSARVAEIAREVLGPAPSRVGAAPKQLLMYRTGEPFQRVAVIVRMNGSEHLVEVLGKGRQYVIHGTHPSGSSYTWDTDIAQGGPDALTMIDHAKVNAFLDELERQLESRVGVQVERVGAVRGARAEHGDLVAPSIDALRDCVAAIPNSSDLFPDRDDYIKFGYAVRAASGEEDEEGYQIYADWCERWEDGSNDPDTVRRDWRRMVPPYAVGWSWLSEIARRHGFAPAQYEFVADSVPAPVTVQETQPEYSDTWCVERVMEDHQHELRYVTDVGKWYVWTGGRWKPDAISLAEYKVGQTLRRIAHTLMHRGASEAERAANEKHARSLSTARRWSDTLRLLQIDPRVTAPMSAFDTDPWLLNTPAGIVDLRTGELGDHRADVLCSKQTLVAPDPDMETPLWDRFLMEVTGGDIDLQEYLQRLMGYALTGSTREQMLAFLWGPGGNGKGVFLHTIMSVMHDYATAVPLDTFAASNTDRHPTDLAGLMGARLVTAQETQSGRRWDEQRVKALTGGDPVRARFMRQDFFTYVPQFTLVFSGNHKPEIRDIDAAMRRRMQLVPFTFTPPVPDPELPNRLRAEYPGVLDWCIRGCLRWQSHGLVQPPVVAEATAEYFADEDPVGRWLEERCDLSDLESFTTGVAVFDDWREWAGRRGVYAGNARRLSQALLAHGVERARTKEARGFRLALTHPPAFVAE